MDKEPEVVDEENDAVDKENEVAVKENEVMDKENEVVEEPKVVEEPEVVEEPPLDVGNKVKCPFIRSEESKEDAKTAIGTILSTRIVIEKRVEVKKYYIHFDGKDKRHDRWVKDDYLSRAELVK